MKASSPFSSQGNQAQGSDGTFGFRINFLVRARHDKGSCALKLSLVSPALLRPVTPVAQGPLGRIRRTMASPSPAVVPSVRSAIPSGGGRLPYSPTCCP